MQSMFGKYRIFRQILCAVIGCSICLVALSTFGSADVASAASTNSAVHHSATDLAKGESTEDLVVIGHDAHIEGNVTDNLVVVNGTVYLSPTSHVATAIDIGGSILRARGSRVDSVYTLTFNQPLLKSSVLGGAMIAGFFSMQLLYSVLFVIIPVLLSLFLKPWFETALADFRASVRRLGAIGLLLSVALIALVIGLSATIVGIPVAFLLFAVYAALGVVGWSLVTMYIGKTLFDAFGKSRHESIETLVGATLLVSITDVPVLGVIAFIVAWSMGLGSVLILARRIRHRKHA